MVLLRVSPELRSFERSISLYHNFSRCEDVEGVVLLQTFEENVQHAFSKKVIVAVLTFSDSYVLKKTIATHDPK